MDDARQLIEDKQREIEDNALDLLDAAAGAKSIQVSVAPTLPTAHFLRSTKPPLHSTPPTKSGSPKQANHETLRHSPWRLRAR